MSTKKTLTRMVEDEIDKGTTTAEEIHKAIADLPLKMLGEIELLKGPAKEVRRVQDRILGAIYDLIRDVNHKVWTFASEMVADLTGTRSAHHERAATPHAARSPA